MRFHIESSVATVTHRILASRNHQCRAYYNTFRHCRNNRTGIFGGPCRKVFPFRAYSSSSSNPETGILRWYLRMLDSRPILTKSVSSACIYAAADITSQLITMAPNEHWDFIRTTRMAGFGLLILGPSQHLWFNFVARLFPKTDVVTTLKKLGMGQLLFGPSINSVFFSFNAALQGESGNEIVARLKRDLIPTLLRGLLYWPLCDFMTYKVISVHLQPLANSSFSYVWTIYLTYMASLKKATVD